MRVGLVGCMKSKQDTPAPAADVYTSALFRGRRAHVTRTCDRWFILSAKHGLVDPMEVLEPYDETLTNASLEARERWSAEVLNALRSRLGDLGSHTFEIHAGMAYRDHGLVEGLRRSAAGVEIPAAGLGQGEQLSFYQRGVATDNCLDAVVSGLVALAAKQGLTRVPETAEELERAPREGWIHLPTCTLSQLGEAFR